MQLVIKTYADDDVGLPGVTFRVELYDFKFEDNDHKESVIEAAKELGVCLTGEAVRVMIE